MKEVKRYSLINKISKAYPKKSCVKLINWFEKNKHLSEKGMGGDIFLNNLEICLHLKSKKDYYGLGTTIINSIKKFKEQYPEIHTKLKPWAVDDGIQLMKFEPGKFYNYLHCENDGHPKYLNRVFAWMIYLNDIEKGGGTEFPYQKVKTKAIAGDFYIWPTSWSHFHKGIKAPKECKYLLTGWASYLPLY